MREFLNTCHNWGAMVNCLANIIFTITELLYTKICILGRFVYDYNVHRSCGW